MGTPDFSTGISPPKAFNHYLPAVPVATPGLCMDLNSSEMLQLCISVKA